ncbi:MAG TPA: ABC transporter substrate-binding protein [Pirellulales bacterium]|nr:ABC transporter substrate-binding protein [Pirellulales bacterium]
MWCSAICRAAGAQENHRYYELEPYDQLTLKEGMTVLKIVPLELKPRAPLGDRKPDAAMVVRRFENPAQRYSVAWDDVAELKLFEELLLDDAAALVKSRKFDEALPYYELLESKYASFPGVAAAVENWLFQEAGWWHKQGDSVQALALLNELHRRNPRHARLRPALIAVAGKQIEAALAEGRVAAARALLGQLADKYSDDPLVKARQEEFTLRAAKALAEALVHQKAGRLRDAHREATAAVVCWPDLAGAKELLRALHDEYPVVTVAVTELPTDRSSQLPLPGAAPAWSELRDRRLIERWLFEPQAAGEMGGVYDSPLGTWQEEADGRQLTWMLSGALRWSTGGQSTGDQSTGDQSGAGRPVAADDVARRLVALADPAGPDYVPAWRRLIDSLEVVEGRQITIHIRHRHPLPAALLRTPLRPWSTTLAGEPATNSCGPFLLDAREDHEVRYRVNAAAAGGWFQEIIEHRYANTDEAIRALRGGRADVIDRLRPWDAGKLAASETVAVEPYAFPTVHFLLPNPARSLTSQPVLRRALVYAIDRARILRDDLLRGERADNGRVLSGPFPLGYANDSSQKPLPYDPSLALALVRAAQAEVAAAAGRPMAAGESLPTFVLAHPATEVARLACRAIQRQMALGGLGITIELREWAGDAVPWAGGDFDLAYVEWPAMEPLVDAARLFGSGSLTGFDSPHVSSALRSLETAHDWSTARRALRDLHRRVNDATAVVPLWQLTEHLAYRRELSGVGPRPATLYQRVEQWKRDAGKEKVTK